MTFYSGFAAARLLELRSRILPEAYKSLFGVVGCQVGVSETDRSLVKRSPTESGETEHDRDASKMRKSGPIRAVVPQKIITN
jgi:hypothetical protein